MKKIFLFVLLINVLSFCKKEKLPARTGDYEVDMKIRLKAACAKIQECNGHLFRTFPDNYTAQDATKACESKSLQNLENSKKFYNDAIRVLSLDCAEKIIQANCEKFIAELVLSSCMQIPKEIKNLSN